MIGALLGGATVMSQAAADARFLAQLGPRTLAVAMAVSSALLALVLVVVGALADRAAKRSVLSGLALVAAAALCGFAALAEVAPQAAAWLGFLGAKQLAAAADLSFWMLATERLDARQSVRALPRLSAVGGIGGAVSAALAVPLASAGGPSAVMVGAAGLLALAALVAWRLPADGGAIGHAPGEGGALALGGVLRRSVRDGVACVVESPLARRLAALVGLGGGFAALVYVGMAAAAAAAARGGSDAELTALLSGIRSAAQIATVAAQLVVAPWLLRKFGTARALLLSPVVAVLGAAVVAVAPSLAAFVALSIASRALDQAVETPAQKLVHTLLPPTSRGRVVGFVEGIAKRSGAVVAGLVAALLVERAAGLGEVLAVSALAWLGAALVMARRMPALAVASAGEAAVAGVTTRSPSLGPRALQQLKRELEEGDDEGGQERRARAIEVLVRQAAEGQIAACAALVEVAARRARAELWEGAALALAHTPSSRVRDEWRVAIERAVGEASDEERTSAAAAPGAVGEEGEAEAWKVAALGALALAGKGAGEAGATSSSSSACEADIAGEAGRGSDAGREGEAVRAPDAGREGEAVRASGVGREGEVVGASDVGREGEAVRDPDAGREGEAVRASDAGREGEAVRASDVGREGGAVRASDADSASAPARFPTTSSTTSSTTSDHRASPPAAPTDSEAVAYATAQVARWWRDPAAAITAAADELRYGDARTRRIAAGELRRYAIRALAEGDDELCLAAAWPLLAVVRRGADEDGPRVTALELLGELAQRLAGRRSAEGALLRTELRALAHQLVEARRGEALAAPLAAPLAAAAVKLLGALLAAAPSISADLGDDLALVVSSLADRDEEVSEAAVEAVRRIGVAATAALLTLAGYGRRAARDRAAALLRELPATEAALDQLVELELRALETTCLALGALAGASLEEPASPRAAALDGLLVRRLDERGREIAHTVLLLAAARHRSPPIGTAAARWRRARGRYERARALAVLDTTLPRALATRLLETVDEAAPLPRAQAVARRTDRPIPSPQEAIGGELGGGDAISRRILLARLPAAALARHRGALAGAAHQLARAADPERLLRRLANSSPATDEGADMPSPVETLLALSQLPLFAGLSTRQLDELARRARRRRAAAGTVIAARGQPLETLILVEEGELVIASRRVLAGALVDELAWLAPRPPEDDVLAARDSRLLELDRATFEELADDVPGLGAGVCRALAERLRG